MASPLLRQTLQIRRREMPHWRSASQPNCRVLIRGLPFAVYDVLQVNCEASPRPKMTRTSADPIPPSSRRRRRYGGRLSAAFLGGVKWTSRSDAQCAGVRARSEPERSTNTTNDSRPATSRREGRSCPRPTSCDASAAAAAGMKLPTSRRVAASHVSVAPSSGAPKPSPLPAEWSTERFPLGRSYRIFCTFICSDIKFMLRPFCSRSWACSNAGNEWPRATFRALSPTARARR